LATANPVVKTELTGPFFFSSILQEPGSLSFDLSGYCLSRRLSTFLPRPPLPFFTLFYFPLSLKKVPPPNLPPSLFPSFPLHKKEGLPSFPGPFPLTPFFFWLGGSMPDCFPLLPTSSRTTPSVVPYRHAPFSVWGIVEEGQGEGSEPPRTPPSSGPSVTTSRRWFCQFGLLIPSPVVASFSRGPRF